MKLQKWYALRGPKYVAQRAFTLLDRYGITPSKAADRLMGSVSMLAEHGCAPTFPTPARVVQRYPQFIRHLQNAGAEIAVHGYDHVDLRGYSVAEACEQLLRAAQVFDRHGIERYGFRCPYLGCTDDVLDSLPVGVFEYSSNKAIEWDVISSTDGGDRPPTASDVLHRLYKPMSALDAVGTPRSQSGIVEIPACLPDDLELHDALGLGPEGMTEAWRQILQRTHQRGELFVLMFHPELAVGCWQPFTTVLREAALMRPTVWIARLRDISSWWRQKADFSVDISPTPAGLQLTFTCTQRATILVRGLLASSSDEEWDGTYRQLRSRSLYVPAEPRPFVGLPSDTPQRVVSFLREQGYILDTGETATCCGTYIDAATMTRLTSEVEIINHIEALPGPLVRYWRWPAGAKSALCVTGDLDALTLLDYASRLFVR